MKRLYILFVALAWLCIAAHAQKRTFLRLYNLEGHKFTKGYFMGTTDSSLFIYKNKNTIEVPVENIGFIRKNRSEAHYFLMPELAIALPFSAVGSGFIIANAGAGILEAAIGTGVGVSLGYFGFLIATPIGIANALSKKQTVFKIDGDINTWQSEKEKIDSLPSGY